MILMFALMKKITSSVAGAWMGLKFLNARIHAIAFLQIFCWNIA